MKFVSLYEIKPLKLTDEKKEYKFTEYFEKEVLRKRSYIKKEWCIKIIENPIRVEKQEHNRYRFWGEIKELKGKIIRVVTLADKKTIHNAFPDRRFKNEN